MRQLLAVAVALVCALALSSCELVPFGLGLSSDLAVTVRVDLSGDPAVLAAFEATWSKSVNPDSPWTIANGVATLNYRRKKKWVR
jgi:hypothetical protein